MKGILVFDQMNDAVYMKLDSDLENHLRKVAIKQGLILQQTQEFVEAEQSPGSSYQRASFGSNEITANVIVQLFSPILTSQYIMQNQFRNAYTSVVCHDGLRLTFTWYSCHQFLAISSDEEEPELLASRRLKIFLKFVNMLYGTTISGLKTEFKSGIDSRPKLLSSLISKWEKCRAEEQSYLVEAIERILINRTLSSTCIKLLEHTIDSMKKVLPSPYSACHSFMLIGSKLLSFYSSRNSQTLNASDLLLLTTLANCVHSQDKKLKNVGITSSLQLSSESLNTAKNIYYDSDPRSESTKFSRFKRSASFIRRMSTSNPRDTSLRRINKNMDISHHLVFLQTLHGSTVPHIVYNIRIASGIILCIVCETGKRYLSKYFTNCMEILLASKLDQIGTKQKEIADLLESSLNRMFSIINQSKLNLNSQRVVKLAMGKWDRLLDLKYLEYLKDPAENQISPIMEATVSSFCESLRELYYLLIYMPELTWENFVQASVQQTLIQLQNDIKFKLSDYIDYLLVKSTQNITMTTYAQDYPGLLHFIYVDRSNDFVIAPCLTKDSTQLNEESNDYDIDLATVSKAKIWKMVEFTQKQIHLGHTSVMWKDNKHYCTYFLWFEDKMGNSLTPKKAITNLNQYPFPGIISGEFYKRYTRECFPDEPPGSVNCFELLCVHVGATSIAFVINFCRRLAAQLGDITGSSLNPMAVS